MLRQKQYGQIAERWHLVPPGELPAEKQHGPQIMQTSGWVLGLEVHQGQMVVDHWLREAIITNVRWGEKKIQVEAPYFHCLEHGG